MHAFLDGPVVAIGRERQRNLVPDEIRAGNLFKEAGAGLEDDRIRKRDDTAAWGIYSVATQLHQVEPHQSDFHHLPGNSCDLDSISDPKSESSDQKEVTRNGQNDAL